MANDNNWGGKREGAGLKTKYGGKRYFFTATEKTTEIIEKIDKYKRSEYINQCIERSAE